MYALLSKLVQTVLNQLQHQSFEAWASAARGRMEDFRARGPQGPATWVYNEGKSIPQGAIEVGKEHDWTLYICRAYIDVSRVSCWPR